jgi:hypothetical protein
MDGFRLVAKIEDRSVTGHEVANAGGGRILRLARATGRGSSVDAGQSGVPSQEFSFARDAGMMSATPLCLFQCPGSAIYALADDQTGRSVRNHNPDIKWLLRAEVARTEVPSTALVLIDREGYRLLGEYEIKNTRPRWLLSEWH